MSKPDRMLTPLQWWALMECDPALMSLTEQDREDVTDLLLCMVRRGWRGAVVVMRAS